MDTLCYMRFSQHASTVYILSNVCITACIVCTYSSACDLYSIHDSGNYLSDVIIYVLEVICFKEFIRGGRCGSRYGPHQRRLAAAAPPVKVRSNPSARKRQAGQGRMLPPIFSLPPVKSLRRATRPPRGPPRHPPADEGSPRQRHRRQTNALLYLR